MYDDAWYNAFVPTRTSQQPKARRPSMLQQPSQAEEADNDATVELPDPAAAPIARPPSPPRPTLVRRARSQGDVRRNSKGSLRTARKKNAVSIDIIQQDEKDGVVETSLDFEAWYSEFEEAVVDASHERYQLYQDQLRLSREHLDRLLEDTALDLGLLSDLSAAFTSVESQTSSFHIRCEGLLAEQKRLSGLADGIAENLKYYSLLDPLTRRLDGPGARHLVRGGDFPQMLANLDKCLEFMQTHPNHSEAAVYQSRYRLLLTRALTLIRVHFTNSLREIASDVSKRIADRQLNDTTMSSLLYAKFRVGAAELRYLGLEIQKRAIPPPGSEPGAQGEYQSLMNELYQSYAAARGRLLVPLIRKKLAEINDAPSTAKDLVAFARTSIGYIRGICLDEYDLWHEWFEGDGGLYDFLEAMSEPLYDYLRPRTVRETQLPKLCEMCSLLQVRYMEGSDDEDDFQEKARLDFAGLIRPALEDVQTRLVFVALAVLREEIERYKPKPADLEHAGKITRVPLSGTRTKNPALTPRKASSTDGPQTPILPKTPLIVEEEGTDPLDLKWRYDTGAPAQEWYPTLRKAIWLLSRIYRLVNSTVFDDLAHQIVHQTTLSLTRASTLIPTTPPKGFPQSPSLYLLKQLLILKQQIVAFDIEYVPAQADINFDFSNITNTFFELRERGGLFNAGNLLRLVGGALVPRVVENMLDAKAELDARLRGVIHEFVNAFAARMLPQIPTAGATSKAAQQQLAALEGPGQAAAAVQATRAAIETEVPVLRTKLDEYIDDARVKETLIAAVEDQVLHSYEDFFDRYTRRSGGNTGAGKNGAVVGTPGSISRKGKGREDDVWDPDTFADWTGTVFGVRLAGGFGLGIQEMEEEDME